MLEAFGQAVDAFSHLRVRVALHQTAQEVERVAVMKGQLGPPAVRGDVEICHSARDRKLEGLVQIHGQTLVRLVSIDALIDSAEGREVAMSCAAFDNGTVGGQLGVCDARAPSLDVPEVVEHFPHLLDRGIDLTGDRELWQLDVLSS